MTYIVSSGALNSTHSPQAHTRHMHNTHFTQCTRQQKGDVAVCVAVNGWDHRQFHNRQKTGWHQKSKPLPNY